MDEIHEAADRRAVVRSTAEKLLEYCRSRDWSGYDPYDALNSRLFRILPFLDFRLARLALTQAVKRSPLNLRPLLGIPRSANPKGLALFLAASVRLEKSGVKNAAGLPALLAARLLEARSPGRAEACWGYNFDWQQRTRLVPKYSPNIICSTFAANALLDADALTPEPAWRAAAASTAEFILRDLWPREPGANPCFSYTLAGRDEVHNANLLGAAFLCRAARVTGDPKFLSPALEAARFSVSRQHEDGSWDYGEAPSQRWIDNFHTGFNLVALRRIRDEAGTAEFDAAIRRGFDFYKLHFFREDGAAKYYHDAALPIDIHSIAQSILTLVEFADSGEDNVALAHSVLDWGLAHMWDRRGFFYYQRRRLWTVRTPFMRWSQAWMLLALAALLSNGGGDGI